MKYDRDKPTKHFEQPKSILNLDIIVVRTWPLLEYSKIEKLVLIGIDDSASDSKSSLDQPKFQDSFFFFFWRIEKIKFILIISLWLFILQPLITEVIEFINTRNGVLHL